MRTPRTAGDTAELLTAIAAGTDGAEMALYDRFADRIHDLALFVSRDPAVAAEVTRDVVVMAASAAPELAEADALRAWLYAHTRSETFTHLDGRGRTPADERVVALPQLPTPHTAADLAGLVLHATAAFGERDLALLALHLRHGLHGEALADAMGVSAGAVEVLLPATLERVESQTRVLLAMTTGSPCCEALSALGEGWDGSFSPRVRRRAPVHATRCAASLAAIPSPLVLLQGIPLAPAPPGLRDAVAERVRLTGGLITGGAAEPRPDGPVAPDPSLEDTLPPGALPTTPADDDATVPPGHGPPPVPVTVPSPAAVAAAAPHAPRRHRMPIPLAVALGVAIGLVVSAAVFRAVVDPVDPDDPADTAVVVTTPAVTDPPAPAPADQRSAAAGAAAGAAAWAGAGQDPESVGPERALELGAIQVGSRTLALGGCGPDQTEVAVIVGAPESVARVVVTATGPTATSQVVLQADRQQPARYVGVLGPFTEAGPVSLTVTALDARDGRADADAGEMSVTAC